MKNVWNSLGFGPPGRLNRQLSHKHVNPIVDFIHPNKFAGEEVRTEGGPKPRHAPWPDFSIKRRTLKSILRLVSAWNADLAISKNGAWCSCRKPGIQGYRLLEKRLEEQGDRGWTIMELLDSGRHDPNPDILANLIR